MQDQIFSLCDSLVKQGIKPTLENVRKGLGGGSFSTINPILKEWKEGQVSKSTPVVSIPPEAVKAVEKATVLLWSMATEHQAETIRTIQTETTRIVQEAKAERDEALVEIQALEAKLKVLEVKTNELQGQVSKQAKEINALSLQNQKLQIALDSGNKALEEAKTEVKESRQEVKQAQNEASKLAGMLEVYKKTAP